MEGAVRSVAGNEREAGGGFAPEEDDGAFVVKVGGTDAEGIGGAVAGVIGGFVAEEFSCDILVTLVRI